MNIVKRNQKLQKYDDEKIRKAIQKAFQSTQNEISINHLDAICKKIKDTVEEHLHSNKITSVEEIQNMVEESLMEYHYFQEARAYILYKEKRKEKRELINQFSKLFPNEKLLKLIKQLQNEFDEDFQPLFVKAQSYAKMDMNLDSILDILIRCSVELIRPESPKWEMIAARFLLMKIDLEISEQEKIHQINSFYDKLLYLTEMKYYGAYILENYSKEEVDELEQTFQFKNDELFTYSSLLLLHKRYLIHSHDHKTLERPQEMMMGIAMHLAIPEKEHKVIWAKQFYEVLSSLKVTMATPTMSNARKPYHQLSSCFIDTVEDSLDGIYKSLDNFAKVSKLGGGMGMYFGKVRANGSDILGFKGAAGGVIPWIKLVNDTAVAVDQLGVRSGAVAVYLDVWHRDLPEFLNLKTNNGDDRQKAHDVFPAVCYPNLFWEMAEKDLNQTWYLMCPHEIQTVKGYCLEDYYGKEWESKYWDCVLDERIEKREIILKDCIRLIIKSAVETGTPFAFNRDYVNEANPNSHKGMIYCSNLCTEIAQNMSPISHIQQEILEVDGEQVVVDTHKSGDFVVCNLASLTLGKIDVENDEELKHLISVTIRALDNVISLNYYPLPYAKITNAHYRAIGLGTSGYHHMLTNLTLPFESEEHLQFVDQLYEKINYYAISASMELAKEKGPYDYFKNSAWDDGSYFQSRGYTSEKWLELAHQVHENGLRNGYLLAIAPTSSTSIISGTTAAIDPIMNRFYLEEKKGSIMPRIAPNLTFETFWLYKQAHSIDQSWIIRSAGIRQRHIDQSQSLNLYITNDYSLRQILDLYLLAYHEKIKTIYYIRSQSLEVEECEVCSS